MHRVDPGSSGRLSSRQRRWLGILGPVAVLAVAVAVAARTVDLRAAADAARTADRRLLAAALAVYALSWPLRGRRYADALAPMDRQLSTGFCTLAVLLSQTANLALPARAGDGVRAYVCKQRRAVPYPSAAASLTVERAFDLAALLAIGALALGGAVAAGVVAPTTAVAVLPSWPSAASPSSPLSDAVAGAVVGAATALGLALLLLLAYPPTRAVVGEATERQHARTTARLAAALPDRATAALRTFARDCHSAARSRRTLALVGAGSLAIWLLDAATAVLVLAAVSSAPAPTLVLVGALAVAAGNLAKVLPLTQGGLGLYEGAFAATVVALSPVAGAVALAAAVLDHALKNGVTLAGGALAGTHLGVSPRRAASGEEA